MWRGILTFRWRRVIIEKRHFKPECSLAVGYVKYDLDLNEEFIDPYPYKVLFRKRPEFREQREARMIIPGVNFLRFPYVNADKWKDHEMMGVTFKPNGHVDMQRHLWAPDS